MSISPQPLPCYERIAFLLPLLSFGLAGCALDVRETSSPAVGGWIDLTPHTVVEIRTPMPEVRLGYYAPKSRDDAAERGMGLAVAPVFAVHPGLGLATAPVTLPLGALFGSLRGMSDAELARCRHAMTSQVAEIQFMRELAKSVTKLGGQHTPYQWRFDPNSPSPADDPHHVIINLHPAYFALTPASRDTEAINPSLEFLAEVNCEIYSSAESQHWVVERFAWYGPTRSLRGWTADPGLVTRAASTGADQLARKILADLFEVNLTSSANRRGRSKGGF